MTTKMFEENITTNENGILQHIKKCCETVSSLQKTDHITRRNTLKEIHNLILCGDTHLQVTSPELENCVQLLITILNDDNERCRELSASTLIRIFETIEIHEWVLSQLCYTLSQLLGKTDMREISEEVRLIEINLLYDLVEKYEGDLLFNFDDISSILKQCIIDDCPDVKRKSCEFVSLLACKQHIKFHMIASNFLNPLLHTVSHQHYQTRLLCVKAIGSIIYHLKDEELDQAMRHLSQRLFDRSPQVRIAVTIVIADMLIDFKDRYSYFHCLIPLLLSSLHDEMPIVWSLAQDLWIRAGNCYLNENDNDYKDLIDFPNLEPEDYPSPGSRPPLGCRLLVHRNIFNILPPLLRDIADSVPETQIKSIQVLYSLILHSEEKITIHITSAIKGIESAAKSEEKQVNEQALRSAELLGYFTDPNLLCDSILTLVHKSPSSSNIGILAACLRGHSGKFPEKCFQEICRFLASPDVCRLRLAPEQANLLLCIEALLDAGNEIDSSSSYNIFVVLMSVTGLSTNESVCKKGEDLCLHLVESLSCSRSSLVKLHIIPFMKVLIENNKMWTPLSPEMPIFSLLLQLEYIDNNLLELVIPALVNNLHPSKDAKLRSEILTLLIPVFQALQHDKYQETSEKILDLVRSGIFPNLQWSAGKAASALRTIAIASLYEILYKNSIRKSMLKSIGDELLPILSTLTEDDAIPTRLTSCKILELVLPLLNGCVDDNKIHKTGFEILHCMDDESDEIRLVTTKILKAYIKSFPKDYNWNMYRSHLKHMYENVLVHMDDKNEEIQLGALELLKEGAFAAPDLLLDEVESKRNLMAAGDACDNLIEHIKNVKL